MNLLPYAPQAYLSYLDENPASAPAVVLLHGLGVSGRCWALQLPALARAGWRALAPDLPGFGRSSVRRGGPHGMRQMAEPIVALLDALGLEQAAVVGLSLGGAAALQLALDHPQRVSGLLLVSTFAHLELARPDLLPFHLLRYALAAAAGLETQARRVARRMFPRPDQAPQRIAFLAQILQADPPAYRAAMRRIVRFNVAPRLGQIACPTLVVTGADDTTVAPANQAALAQGIRGARQVVIPAAGHALIAEKPAEFNQIMLDFLDSLKETGASAPGGM